MLGVMEIPYLLDREEAPLEAWGLKKTTFMSLQQVASNSAFSSLINHLFQIKETLRETSSYLGSCKPCKLFTVHHQTVGGIQSLLDLLSAGQDEEVPDVKALHPLDLLLEAAPVWGQLVDEVPHGHVEQQVLVVVGHD